MAYRDERRAKRRRLRRQYLPSQRVRRSEFVAWVPPEPDPSVWARIRGALEWIGETLVVPIWVIGDWLRRRLRV